MRANETNLYGCVLVALAVVAIFGQSASADTSVGGIIAVDAHWTAAGGPYIVGTDLEVVNNATLTIDPGVEVRFAPATTLKVSLGQLIARGAEANMIRFTANVSGTVADSDRWGYIKFDNGAVDATFDLDGNYTGGSIIEHATIEYAGNVAATLPVIDTYYAVPHISHCLIRNNTKGAIRGYYADGLRITGNTITGNEGMAVDLDQSENVVLSHNTITNNDSGLSLNGADYLTLTGDRITGNSIVGVRIHRGGHDIEGLTLSTDPTDPTWIYGNKDGLGNVYNDMLFHSFELGGRGNVDARNVWWGTIDPVEIENGIYHYMDNNDRGIVFYDPWAVPEPATLLLLAFGGLALTRRRRGQK